MYVHVAATQPARSQSIAEDKSWAENACINQFQTKKGGHPLSYHTRGSVLTLMKMMKVCTVQRKRQFRWTDGHMGHLIVARLYTCKVGKEVDSDLYVERGDGTWRTTLPLCNISDAPTILLFVTTQSLPFICPLCELRL